MNNKRIFLGIKQVLKTTFDSYSLEEKVGYVWFVRNEEDNHLEIYLGSIKYADTNENVASQEYVDNIIEKLRITIGLDENLNLPQDFNYETIINAINDLFDNKTELLMQMSGLTNDIETLKNEIINNEHVISESILTIKDLIGLTNNFTLPYDFAHYNTIIEGINDRYRKDETYSKNEIHRLINGFFRFKGKVEYISDLELILNPINGDVYMVEKKSIETPVVINSEFVYTTDEFGLLGEWIELGPLFDITIFDEKFNSIKDAIGLTDDLNLPEDFKQDSIIDAINENYNEIKNDVNSLQEQIDIVVSGLPKTYTVNFYLDDETYNNPRFIAKTTIHEGDCLIDYPSIRIDDYSDYAYWDTELYDLYHISNDINVSYVTTIINRVKNPQLLDIMYNEHLCNDYNYMKISEAQAVNDEQWFKLSNTIKYIEIYGQSNLIEVTGEIYNNDGKLMDNYNLWNWEVYDGDEIFNIIDNGFYTFDLNGNKIEFNVDTINNFYNEFYMLENFDEFQYFTNITSISGFEDKKEFASFFDSNIKSIKLPNSVTNIGNYAFAECRSLTSVTIPNSVTNIGEGVFNACSSLTSVTIPNSVTSIGGTAFGFCSNLTSVTIPNSVESIGYRAFWECSSLTSVTIPNSVTIIENYAFSGCTSLTSITLNWTDSDSILTFNSNWGLPTVPSYYTYPDGLEELYYEKGWPSQFTLECVVHNGTIEITPSATTYQYGTEVTLTVTPIDGQEFLGWDDMNMDNPRTITITGNTYLEAFCTSYVYHTITIGEVQNGTLDVDKTTAKVGDTIKITPNPDYGYQNPDTRDITVLASSGQTIDVQLNKLGEYTFTMPDDDVTITSIFPPIQVNVTFIANNCTIKCGDDIEVQDTEGTYTKAYNSEITIDVTPNEGYQFTQWADGDTTNPKTAIITSIEPITFEAICSEVIKQYTVTATAINGTVDGSGTYNSGDTCTLTVTANSGYTFKQWSDGNTDNPRTIVVTQNIVLTAVCETSQQTYTKIYYNATEDLSTSVGSTLGNVSLLSDSCTYNSETGDGVLTYNGDINNIDNNYFGSKTVLRNIILPNSVTNIGIDAFYDCSSLSSITIPNSVTSIGDGAFKDCSSLTSVVWNAKHCADFISINEAPFDDIALQITSFTFGSEVEYIPIHLCYGMDNLTSVTIPNSVTSIGSYAFQNCTKMSNIILQEGLLNIGSHAFSNTGIIELTIPSTVVKLYYSTDLTKLVKLTLNCDLPNSILNNNTIIQNCTSLKTIEFGTNVLTINDNINNGNLFYNCPINTIICHMTTAPNINSSTFYSRESTGTLHVPIGSDYSQWESILGSGWTVVYDVE